MTGSTPIHEPVRSYVRRASRLTAGQKRALEQLWPQYGIEFSISELHFDDVFGRRATRTLEIGFGNGELLTTMAAARPDVDFIGVEVHEPGTGHCLLQIEKRALSNVRLIRHDAVEVLNYQVPDAALNQINLFFADPWPKKKHHKRRIVQPDFVALLSRKILPGGFFHVATDWTNYAEHIEETVNACRYFEPVVTSDVTRPETKFELRGKRLGHEISELVYRRV